GPSDTLICSDVTSRTAPPRGSKPMSGTVGCWRTIPSVAPGSHCSPPAARHETRRICSTMVHPQLRANSRAEGSQCSGGAVKERGEPRGVFRIGRDEAHGVGYNLWSTRQIEERHPPATSPALPGHALTTFCAFCPPARQGGQYFPFARGFHGSGLST